MTLTSLDIYSAPAKPGWNNQFNVAARRCLCECWNEANR
jgi:hypothetical protein